MSYTKENLTILKYHELRNIEKNLGIDSGDNATKEVIIKNILERQTENIKSDKGNFYDPNEHLFKKLYDNVYCAFFVGNDNKDRFLKNLNTDEVFVEYDKLPDDAMEITGYDRDNKAVLKGLK
jgi:hypothetical protein